MRGATLEARLHAQWPRLRPAPRAWARGNVSTKRPASNGGTRRPFRKVKLTGQDLRVVDVPEAQIDASPDLEFNINGRHIEVDGAVKVPYAKIVPKDLTNAVRALHPMKC